MMRALTPALLAREALVMARDLPWQMKLGAPFHCLSRAEIPRGSLSSSIDAFVTGHLRPALLKAMERRSPAWDNPMELPGWACLAAVEIFAGTTCRVVIGDDPMSNRLMMALDFEFPAHSCNVPLYNWLGEQAEAA